MPSLKSSAEWEYKLARFPCAERYDSERLALIVHPSVNRSLDLYSGLLNEALYFQSLYKQVYLLRSNKGVTCLCHKFILFPRNFVESSGRKQFYKGIIISCCKMCINLSTTVLLPPTTTSVCFQSKKG